MRSLGVDLGGSGFRLGVFDTSSGRLEGYLERHAHAESTEPEAVLSALEAAIDAIGWEGPIGLGFPGAINDHRPVTAPNLGEAWTRTDVKTRLEPFHKGRFAMLNDADAVAEAERIFGAGHAQAACVLTLTIGTGLGTTLHRDGAMIANLEYGRWPHPHRPGLLEEHLSGRARTLAGQSLAQWATLFQEGLSYLESRLEPDRIVLYGGIMEHWDELEPMLTTTAETVPALLKETAGPLGAALAAVSGIQAL